MADLTRREALTAAAATLSLGIRALEATNAQAPATAASAPQARAVKKGRLKQSVSRWCYQKHPACPSSARRWPRWG